MWLVETSSGSFPGRALDDCLLALNSFSPKFILVIMKYVAVVWDVTQSYNVDVIKYWN